MTQEKKPRFKDFVLTEADAPHLEKLVPEHRDILAATGSYEELAVSLGVARGTVKSRINRARTALVKLRQAAAAPVEEEVS